MPLELTLLFTFRNLELERVKIVMDSLVTQLDSLTKEVQFKAISKLNEQYFFKNRDKKLVVVNSENWGMSISKEEYEA